MKNHSPLAIGHKQRARRGIATLPTILALMVLLLVLAVGVTYLSFTENQISGGQNNSSQALQYAEAGARDALQRIARNKNYNCAASSTANCYSVAFFSDGCTANTGCAQVAVSTASGTASAPKIVTSTGIVGSNQRTIQVQVIFDSNLNGQIATTTWTEVTQ